MGDRGNNLSKGQLREALTILNNRWGRGDITRVEYLSPGYIVVHVQKQYGTETFTATVNNRTVRARRHQITMPVHVHDWKEQPGEPPRDVCFGCGKERQ